MNPPEELACVKAFETVRRQRAFHLFAVQFRQIDRTLHRHLLTALSAQRGFDCDCTESRDMISKFF
jgi:hypothetical protein